MQCLVIIKGQSCSKIQKIGSIASLAILVHSVHGMPICLGYTMMFYDLTSGNKAVATVSYISDFSYHTVLS